MEFQRTLCLFVFLFITLISSSQANNFSVGWTPNPSESLNQWSGRNRFQVNDTIVFKYQKGSDSVLEVKKEDYDKCNKTNPIQKFEDGNTVFKFDRPGPFYFISGNNGTCENGQKLIVVVISPRSTTKSPPSPSPAATSPSLSPTATQPSPSPAATSPSLSPTATPPSPSPAMSTPPAGGPSPMPGSMSPSPSPSPSPSISTPPAGGPSPMSMAPESEIPSPSPNGSSPEGSPLAPGAPSGSGMAPGSDSSNAMAPPPGSSGSFVTPSRFLVLIVTVVGAAFMRY